MKIMQSKILLISVSAFLALTACQSETALQNPEESGGNAAVKKTVADSDPQTILLGSMKSFQEVKSWIADVESSNDVSPQGEMKMQIKYSAPDNFQVEGTAAANEMRIISVGEETFLQMNGKWQKAPASANMGQMINNWREMFSDQKLAALKNIQFAGKETIDGRELSVYTYEIDAQAAMPDEVKNKMTDEMKARLNEMQSENKAKIWIDTEKNLPFKMETTMKMSKPQELTQKMSVNYKYDQAVQIKAPKLK